MRNDLSGTSTQAVGNRIRAVRKAKGLKSTMFAKLCGLSKSALSNYEKGTRRPTVEQAGKIAASTGAGLNWIYYGVRADLPADISIKIFGSDPTETL